MSNTHKVKLNWFHENKDYHNFWNFKHPDPDVVRRIMKSLNTNGDAWTIEGMRYPLIVSKVAKRYKEHFDDPFIFRSWVDNNSSKPASDDDLKMLLDVCHNQHHPANYTKAHFLVGHENQYVRKFGESIIKGEWDDIEFDVSETHFDKDDQLKLETAKS